MKPLEVIWFENISAFNEQVLGLGPIRASMKQLLYTMLALALAFSILNIAKNLILAIPIAGFLLLLAYAKPYGQNMEVLLIDMVGFLFKRKSIGAVREDKKVKEKEEKKEKKDKDKEEPQLVPTTEPTPTATTAVVVGEQTPVSAPINVEIATKPTTTVVTVPVVEVFGNSNSNSSSSVNVLHYIVPTTTDLNLELTDKDCIIATGESTIHIAEDISNALIVIEVKNKTITRIIVNKQ